MVKVNCSLRKEFATSGSKFFPFWEVPIFKRDTIEENHCLIQKSPVDVQSFFSILATPLTWLSFCQQHYFQSGPSVNRLTGAGASQLILDWTIQHGCGGNEDTDPQKQNCNLVLQFMCEDAVENIPGNLKGTATLMVTTFYMKDLHKQWT